MYDYGKDGGYIQGQDPLRPPGKVPLFPEDSGEWHPDPTELKRLHKQKKQLDSKLSTVLKAMGAEARKMGLRQRDVLPMLRRSLGLASLKQVPSAYVELFLDGLYRR